MQNSVMFDLLKIKKNHFDGIGLKIESVVHIGKTNGLYVAPYLKWRSYSSIITTYNNGYNVSTGQSISVATDTKVKGSSIAFGIRVGVYLSE